MILSEGSAKLKHPTMKFRSKVLEIENMHLGIINCSTVEQARTETEFQMKQFETDSSWGLSDKLVRWTILSVQDRTIDKRFPMFRAVVRTVSNILEEDSASSRDEAMSQVQRRFYHKEEKSYDKSYRWTLLTLDKVLE